MKYDKDSRVVLTLDAGGTNFVFSAIQGFREIMDPICLPSNAHDLTLCLNTIVDGFRQIESKLKGYPVAISFAFPGPADYTMGIIGDLNNLPAFRGGVPLGPFLEEKFNVPVYINNDGDLFTYGEAIAGLLTYINSKFNDIAISKSYRNLLGVTLGTGFGAGIVSKNELFTGDNSSGAEIWVMRNKLYNTFSEESISIRGVAGAYKRHAGLKEEKNYSPKDISEIASGKQKGDSEAAKKAYAEFGEILGDCIANAITLIDGLVVIGGGISAAHELFMPSLMKEMNSKFTSMDSNPVPRLEMKAFNLEDSIEMSAFLTGNYKEIQIPQSSRTVLYDPLKRIGVGISKLGTSKAVSFGAYAYALHRLDHHL
jgi:glucokinase